MFRSSLVESYKKKTKVELQRSIKSLKDDNAMFTNLNQDLRRILTGVSRVQSVLCDTYNACTINLHDVIAFGI